MENKIEAVSRRAAAEGMVLLKNDDCALPLKKEESVAFVGGGCFDYKKGGLGSANVTTILQVLATGWKIARNCRVVLSILPKGLIKWV